MVFDDGCHCFGAFRVKAEKGKHLVASLVAYGLLNLNSMLSNHNGVYNRERKRDRHVFSITTNERLKD